MLFEPTTRNQIVIALETYGSMSTDELVAEVGKDRTVIAPAIKRAKKLKILYIGKWKRSTGRGQVWIPQYMLGAGPDVKKPSPKSDSVRGKAYRTRNKKRRELKEAIKKDGHVNHWLHLLQ